MFFGSLLMTAMGGEAALPWWRTDPTVFAALPFGAFGFSEVVSAYTVTRQGTTSINADGDLICASSSGLTIPLSWSNSGESWLSVAGWTRYTTLTAQNTPRKLGNATNAHYTNFGTTLNSLMFQAGFLSRYFSTTTISSPNHDGADWHHYAYSIYNNYASDIAQAYLWLDGEYVGSQANVRIHSSFTGWTVMHSGFGNTARYRDIIMASRKWDATDPASLIAIGRGNMWST